ncbi:MAG: hypothetical protein WD757_05045 [Actinomycetota bacterium]
MIWRIIVGLAIGGVILWLGIIALRAVSAGAGRTERIEPEDVADLDVFFVCRECGTEYKVTQLGEIQIPRHCGEPMEVVRRPRAPGTHPG